MLSAKEVDKLVDHALERAYAAGRRASKMEHERNEARRRLGLLRKRVRESRALAHTKEVEALSAKLAARDMAFDILQKEMIRLQGIAATQNEALLQKNRVLKNLIERARAQGTLA